MSKNVTIDVSELVTFAKSLGTHGPGIIANELAKSMVATGELIERAATIKAGPSVNTGSLRASISSQAKGHGFGTSVEVGTVVEYGAPVEYGSSYPGPVPPRAPLARWARRKLGLDQRQSEVFAYHFQKKVKSSGIKGKPFLGPAVDEQLGAIDKIFAAGVERATAKLAALGG